MSNLFSTFVLLVGWLVGRMMNGNDTLDGRVMLVGRGTTMTIVSLVGRTANGPPLGSGAPCANWKGRAARAARARRGVVKCIVAV